MTRLERTGVQSENRFSATSDEHQLRRGGWMPATVGLLGALISIAWSWQPSFWSDEVATLRAARLSWPELMQFVQHKDAVHAAYYSFMHLWIGCCGESALAVRAPSAIAVGVAAAGVAVLGTRLGDRRLGLIAAIVFIVLPRTTYMGTEVRSYALTAAIAVWATVALTRSSSSTRRAPWVIYVSLMTLSGLVFVYSFLLVPVHALYLVFAHRSRRTAIRWAVGAAVAVIACFPFLLFASQQKQQISWLAGQPVVNAWTILVEPFFDSSWGAAAVFLLLTAAALAIRSNRDRLLTEPSLVLAAAWAVVPMGLLLVANAVDGPLYLARYLSFCVPGVALLFAVILRSFARNWLTATGIALLVAVSLPTYLAQRGPYAKNGGSDLAAVAAYIQNHSGAGDAVLFSEAGPSTLRPRLALYAYPRAFRNDADIAFVRAFNRSGHWSFSDMLAPTRRLGQQLDRHSRVWYIEPGSKASCGAGSDVSLLRARGFSLRERTATNRETICEFVRQT